MSTQQTGLEAARYFSQLEAEVVKRLHRDAESTESRSELIRSTGVKDEALIDELARMGISVHELVTLRLLPLVLVAWAEDHADSHERDVIHRYAEKLGIAPDSTAGVLLDTWLRRRPPGIGVDAWKRYTQDMLKRLSTANAKRLIHLTEQQMIQVAKASGGVLGIGKISKKERTMIDRLVAVMEQQL